MGRVPHVKRLRINNAVLLCHRYDDCVAQMCCRAMERSRGKIISRSSSGLTIFCDICSRHVSLSNVARHRRSHRQSTQQPEVGERQMRSHSRGRRTEIDSPRLPRTFQVHRVIRQGELPPLPTFQRYALYTRCTNRLATIAARSDCAVNLRHVAAVAYPELTREERSLCARLATTSVLAARSVYTSRLNRFINSSEVQLTSAVCLSSLTQTDDPPPTSEQTGVCNPTEPRPRSDLVVPDDLNGLDLGFRQDADILQLDEQPIPELLLDEGILPPSTFSDSPYPYPETDPFLTSCVGPSTSDQSDHDLMTTVETTRSAYGRPIKKRTRAATPMTVRAPTLEAPTIQPWNTTDAQLAPIQHTSAVSVPTVTSYTVATIEPKSNAQAEVSPPFKAHTPASTHIPVNPTIVETDLVLDLSLAAKPSSTPAVSSSVGAATSGSLSAPPSRLLAPRKDVRTTQRSPLHHRRHCPSRDDRDRQRPHFTRYPPRPPRISSHHRASRHNEDRHSRYKSRY